MEGLPSTELSKAFHTQRGEILHTALTLTEGDRNRSYGDPYDNFIVTTELKRIFWEHAAKGNELRLKKTLENPTSEFTVRPAPFMLEQNTPFGHAIDMVLTNLGRLASSPAPHCQEDRFIDGSCYFAIAGELAVRG